MEKKRNIFGGGKNTNKNGLMFEKNTNLVDALKLQEGITVDIDNRIYQNGELVGMYVEKHELYSKFLTGLGVKWKDHISSKLLPDSVFVNLKNKTIYVGEKKYQQNSGSVDEKLQGCGFKKRQYLNLCGKINFKVEYYFLLNEWFLKDKYRDVKEYILESGCKYYINEIPMKDLGL